LEARHGFERPGWFLPGGDTRLRPYDYYGAYAEGAWRLSEGHPDVPPNPDDPYRRQIEGECTFGRPASFDLVAAECRATREGVGLYDQSYFGNFYLQGPDAAEAVG
jgi:sarcosine dehydrogenase